MKIEDNKYKYISVYIVFMEYLFHKESTGRNTFYYALFFLCDSLYFVVLWYESKID